MVNNKCRGIKTSVIKFLLISLFQRGEWFDTLTMTFVILGVSQDGIVGQGEIF
jgi:hypothetical protein